MIISFILNGYYLNVYSLHNSTTRPALSLRVIEEYLQLCVGGCEGVGFDILKGCAPNDICCTCNVHVLNTCKYVDQCMCPDLLYFKHLQIWFIIFSDQFCQNGFGCLFFLEEQKYKRYENKLVKFISCDLLTTLSKKFQTCYTLKDFIVSANKYWPASITLYKRLLFKAVFFVRIKYFFLFAIQMYPFDIEMLSSPNVPLNV